MAWNWQVFEAKTADQFDDAFGAMARAHVGGLIVFPSPMFYAQYRRLVGSATRHGLPTVYYFGEAVEAGGLMCYGADIPYLFRRAAAYVERIVRGAKPADLPIEQPTKFEMLVNLKTAQTLGLTVPPSLLRRADQIIEQ